MIDIKEGDVFRWYYKNDTEYRASCGGGTAYWCMDNKCVFKDGELCDTYWIGPYQNGYSSNTRILDPAKVDLELICNLNDVEIIREYEIEDYDNVYNLSYQKGCYPLYAVDAGATKSNNALRTKYLRKIQEAESNKRSAEYDIEYYNRLILELEG